jgi:hypothetical protein
LDNAFRQLDATYGSFGALSADSPNRPGVVVAEDILESEFIDDAREFWAAIFQRDPIEDCIPESGQFVDGFVDGALAVWTEVKRHL